MIQKVMAVKSLGLATTLSSFFVVLVLKKETALIYNPLPNFDKKSLNNQIGTLMQIKVV